MYHLVDFLTHNNIQSIISFKCHNPIGQPNPITEIILFPFIFFIQLITRSQKLAITCNFYKGIDALRCSQTERNHTTQTQIPPK